MKRTSNKAMSGILVDRTTIRLSRSW